MSASLFPMAAGSGAGPWCGMWSGCSGQEEWLPPQEPRLSLGGVPLACCCGCESNGSQSPHPEIEAGPGSEGGCRKSRTDGGMGTVLEA